MKIAFIMIIALVLCVMAGCLYAADTTADSTSPAIAASETLSPSASALESRAPGDRNIDEIADNFIKLVKEKNISELDSYIEIPDDDLKWLYGESMPVTVNSARGVEFSDGSFVILLKLPARNGGYDSKQNSELNDKIKSTALDSALCKDKDIFVSVYGVFSDYGFIGYYGKYGDILWDAAEFARQI